MASSGLAGRILAFGSLPFFGGVSPLLVLPILSRQIGADGWAGLLLSQSIGTFVAAFLLFGIPVVGSARVAVIGSVADSVEYYQNTLVSRTCAGFIAVPVGGLIIGFGVSLGDPALNILMYLSACLGAASFAWFCIGRGNAQWIAKYELVPKLVATVVSAGAVLATSLSWLYPVFLIGASIWGLLSFNRMLFGRPYVRLRGANARATSWRHYVETWHAGVLSIAAGAYATAPLPVASAMGTASAVSAMASADRTYRYGLFAVSGLGNALQGWILSQRGPERRRRNLIGIWAHVLLGACGFIFLSKFGVWFTQSLFGDSVSATSAQVFWYGVTFLAVSASTPFVRNLLIPNGRTRLVMISSLIAALFGLASMVTFGAMFGVTGIAAGLAVAEILSLAIVASSALRYLRRD